MILSHRLWFYLWCGCGGIASIDRCVVLVGGRLGAAGVVAVIGEWPPEGLVVSRRWRLWR